MVVDVDVVVPVSVSVVVVVVVVLVPSVVVVLVDVELVLGKVTDGPVDKVSPTGTPRSSAAQAAKPPAAEITSCRRVMSMVSPNLLALRRGQ